MKRWQAIATVLALAAGLSSGALAQDWGHRDGDHDRDDVHRRDHDRDRDRDRDWDHDRDRHRRWDWDHDRDDAYRNRNWGYYPNNRGWGYHPNGGYYPYGNPNAGWGWGNRPYGYGGYGNQAYQYGYNDGLNDGRADWSHNRGFRAQADSNYRHANHGYMKAYGDKVGYAQMYRDGYMNGYRAAFGRRW